MGLFSSLSREQKESVGLLQMGTFLEYFDLMLYVHMAVLLNDIFFPKTNPHTASLLAAFALCSTLAFRPIGALIFGWIGDRIGRKVTIVITTAMMAISCIVMANLPTYAQIGISAAWIVTICRILQGISSMGEIVGADIYLTEDIKPPARYSASSSIHAANSLGGSFALGIAFLFISFDINWRFAFWVGAAIAIVTVSARIRLRETPVFLEMKRNELKKGIEELNLEFDPIRGAGVNAAWKERLNYKTLMAYFLITCGTAFRFYLVFFHFIPFLKESFGYNSRDIIIHNFFLAFIDFMNVTVLMYLSYWVHPLKIQKIRTYVAFLFMILLPFLIMSVTSPVHLFLMQSLILILSPEEVPATPVYLSHFPVYCRFRCATLLFSVARALMYSITSFGLIYLVSYLGSFGIWVIALPIVVASLYGISYFEGLECQRDLIHKRIRAGRPKIVTL